MAHTMKTNYLRRSHVFKNESKSKNDDLKNDRILRVEKLIEPSQHFLAVSEQEKANLARELHDELGSNLTAIRLDLLTIQENLREKEPDLAAQLQQTLKILQRTFDSKRRIIENLYPSTLEDLGLATAIRIHGEEIAQRAGLNIDIKIDEDATDIDPARAIAIYRIVQESLTNTVKYAKAKRVSISLTRNHAGFSLQISDDGVGIAKDIIRKPSSHGIVGMHERASLLGGSFDLRPSAEGTGTHIRVFIPYPARLIT